jgi:outer membrane receptor for ferrienterochelin and colicins
LIGPVPTASSETPDVFTFHGQWWNSDVQLSRSLLSRHKLTFGTEITDNFKQDQSNFDPDIDPVPVNVPYHSLIWAVYAQGEFAITQKLSATAGVRYDHYYNGFGGTANPRLGLVYHLLRSTTAKVLYGSAFRAPEPYELFPAFGSFYESNRALQPETIRTIEGLIDQGLGDRFSVEGSVFQNRISNLITLNTDPITQRSVYQNLESARSTGVELELNAKLVGSLRARASYSYTQTTDELTGQAPPNSPASLVKLNLGAPLLHQKLFAAADAQYTGSVTTLAGNTLAGFAVVNATLTGHTWGKHLDISASVYNLLNKKYADPARPEDPENAIPQDGRTFAVKTTFRFFR